MAKFKNPSTSNITDSKPAAKRPSIAENNGESYYKRHALPSDGSWRKALPTASNLEKQTAKKPDEPQDDLEHLRNEIKVFEVVSEVLTRFYPRTSMFQPNLSFCLQ